MISLELQKIKELSLTRRIVQCSYIRYAFWILFVSLAIYGNTLFKKHVESFQHWLYWFDSYFQNARIDVTLGQFITLQIFIVIIHRLRKRKLFLLICELSNKAPREYFARYTDIYLYIYNCFFIHFYLQGDYISSSIHIPTYIPFYLFWFIYSFIYLYASYSNSCKMIIRENVNISNRKVCFFVPL